MDGDSRVINGGANCFWFLLHGMAEGGHRGSPHLSLSWGALVLPGSQPVRQQVGEGVGTTWLTLGPFVFTIREQVNGAIPRGLCGPSHAALMCCPVCACDHKANSACAHIHTCAVPSSSSGATSRSREKKPIVTGGGGAQWPCRSLGP